MGKLANKIFSETTYYNLQVFPLMLMLIPSMLLIFVNIMIFFYMMLGYGVYVIALKYGKMNYEQKYKIYRFIDTTLYDIDYHKAIRGWIDVDISETYPLEMGDKDELKLKIKQTQKIIADYEKRRDDLKLILLEMQEEVKKKGKKKKKKKKKKEEKPPSIYDEEDGYNEFSDSKEDEDGFVEDDFELGNEEENKEIEPEEQMEEMKKELEETKKMAELGLKTKKIEKLIMEYDAIIEDYKFEIKKLEDIKDNTKEQKEYLDKVRKENKLSENWKFYRSRIEWSDIYRKTKEVIFILPSNFDETFNFTDDTGNFDGIWLQVPNYACATFVEIESFKGVPYLLCVMSSWWIKESRLTNIKKEEAEPLILDAIIRQLADDVAQIQSEYKTQAFQIMQLEADVKQYMLFIKKMEKKHRLRMKQLAREQKFSWESPPKPLYAITIIGWVMALIFFLLFLFYPMLFGTPTATG